MGQDSPKITPNNCVKEPKNVLANIAAFNTLEDIVELHDDYFPTSQRVASIVAREPQRLMPPRMWVLIMYIKRWMRANMGSIVGPKSISFSFNNMNFVEGLNMHVTSHTRLPLIRLGVDVSIYPLVARKNN